MLMHVNIISKLCVMVIYRCSSFCTLFCLSFVSNCITLYTYIFVLVFIVFHFMLSIFCGSYFCGINSRVFFYFLFKYATYNSISIIHRVFNLSSNKIIIKIALLKYENFMRFILERF